MNAPTNSVEQAAATLFRSTPAGSSDAKDLKVCLLGASLGTGNRGVSALGASLVRLVQWEKPQADIGLLIGRKNSEPFSLRTPDGMRLIRVVNYRQSPRSAPNQHLAWIVLAALLYRLVPVRAFRSSLARSTPWVKELVLADVVGDIRGGDSFSDIYGLKRIILGSLPTLSVLFVRGDIVLFPQTYGPYKSAFARAVARFILLRASLILARDLESLQTVSQLIGPSTRCRFCPDVAFILEAIQPEEPDIRPPLPVPKVSCLVGLNVNGLMWNGGYTRSNMFGLKLDYRTFLKEVLQTLLRDPSVHVLMVPHTFAPPQSVESDPEACRQVAASLPSELTSRVHMVSKEYDQSEIKGVIGMCDFFIGSRMHACIAALSQGIPAVGVAYSKKFRGVFESVGMEDWIIDGREMDTEAALERVKTLFERREKVRAGLKRRVEEAQKLLAATFRELLAERRIASARN